MKVSFENQLQVIYGRGCKRVTLQRAITSKVIFFKKEVSFRDLLILFDNILWLQDIASKDPNFSEKFGLHLKVQALLLKEVRINENNVQEVTEKLSEGFSKNLEGFYFLKRNTKNELLKQNKFVEVRPGKLQGVDNRKLPPKPYIGIGYRDKGSARNLSYDGSPTWQEVASAKLWQRD